ncbi:hypothetical protein A3Q56_00233 [Intoshia linei]|uniref:SAC domain-containing protein n=1 Tax=Intoshia linei TaxID=1819745 RepID=A0A177BCE9_9BILA|nr:hypothetical protein A3Q56_00233 [Intoshia linei]
MLSPSIALKVDKQKISPDKYIKNGLDLKYKSDAKVLRRLSNTNSGKSTRRRLVLKNGKLNVVYCQCEMTWKEEIDEIKSAKLHSKLTSKCSDGSEILKSSEQMYTRSIVHTNQSNSFKKLSKAMALMVISENNSFIGDLNLSYNFLEDKGGVYILEMLKENGFITTLNLSYNSLSTEFAIYFVRLIDNNISLRELDLSGLSENVSIIDLNLSWNSIRKCGAVNISNSLKKNNWLKILNLSFNGFGLEGSLALSQMFKVNNSLEELYISNNRINEVGATLLAKGLLENSNLKIFDISYNPIQNMGACAIVKALDQSTVSKLNLLDFTNIHVDEPFNVHLNSIMLKKNFKCLYGFRKLTGRKEFTIHPMIKLSRFIERKNLRIVDVFRSMDKDNSNSITHDEFKDGLLEAGVKLSSEEIQILIDDIDKDGDGEINYSDASLKNFKVMRVNVSSNSKIVANTKFKCCCVDKTFADENLAKNYISENINGHLLPSAKRLEFCDNGIAILGMYRCYQSLYIILVKKRKIVANVCGHDIYKIEKYTNVCLNNNCNPAYDKMLGYVANDVETELIVNNVPLINPLDGTYCAYVIRRGSVPIYWSNNDAITHCIKLTRPCPFFRGADKHISSLIDRYEGNAIILNLCKIKPSNKNEKLLSEKFLEGIEYFNQFLHVKNQICYYNYDISSSNSDSSESVSDKFLHFSNEFLKKTSIFCSTNGKTIMQQKGIVRVNCVDCLDRTNAGQYFIIRNVFAKMLNILKFTIPNSKCFHNIIMKELQTMFEENGDVLAFLYTGSGLVHQIDYYMFENNLQRKSRNVYQLMSRFYSNTFSDYDKQKSINIFFYGHQLIDKYAMDKMMASELLSSLNNDDFLHNDPIEFVTNLTTKCDNIRNSLQKIEILLKQRTPKKHNQSIGLTMVKKYNLHEIGNVTFLSDLINKLNLYGSNYNLNIMECSICKPNRKLKDNFISSPNFSKYILTNTKPIKIANINKIRPTTGLDINLKETDIISIQKYNDPNHNASIIYNKWREQDTLHSLMAYLNATLSSQSY